MKSPKIKEKIKSVDRTKAKDSVKGFWHEFREFAVKGNVIDLAVGVIIGSAFNTIVQSLVNDIIMPIFGKIIGNAAFSELYINLSDKSFTKLADAKAAGAPVIAYGQFLTNILNFFIVALTIFVILKVFFRQKKEQQEIDQEK